jgi:hypothetical protein
LARAGSCDFNLDARIGFAGFDDGVVAGDEFFEGVAALIMNSF